MLDSISLSRREMLLASGIMITGITNRAMAQTAADKQLIFRSEDPRNAEPELEQLVENWLTPTRLFYIRSHATNPQIDASSYRLRVEGLVYRPLSFTLDQLRQVRERTITATLTCAGNRREEFNHQAPVGGVQWQAGAIGNATWTGVPLAAVLELTGVQPEARDVWFEGLDQIDHEGETIPFGASIPIERALDSDSESSPLLVYGMNGAELLPDHGYPLRTVVPGYIGARSVKWLGKIVVSDRPSPNHFVATAYKLVQDSQPLDWAEAGPIYRYPINAAMTRPSSGNGVDASQLKSGPVTVRGYALPTGVADARIARVSVSANGGQTWTNATLTGENSAFCWQLWEATVEVTSDTRELVVRAQDTSGGFMPARVPWNAKGYLQNAWYRLPVEVE